MTANTNHTRAPTDRQTADKPWKIRMFRFLILVSALAGSNALVVNPGARLGAVASSPKAQFNRAYIAMSEAAKVDDKEEDRLGAGGRGGHAVGEQPKLSEEEQKVQQAVMEHQKGAARLSQAEDARSLVEYSSGYAVLSTLSSQVDGYPSGALVGFAPDKSGLPVFCFSSMSSHTKDLLADGASKDGGSAKAALTVTAKGFEGAADGRVVLIGDVVKCNADEVAEESLREVYKAKHPNAFWADFGDFTYFRMTALKQVNFVGGFARAGSITADEYVEAAVDPIQAFAEPVMGHMNADHASSTVAMVQHFIGLNQVDTAELVQMDRLGFMVQIGRLGQTFKLRLPFPRAAENRGDVKKLIVEMTQAAMANEEVQAHLQTIEAKNSGEKSA